jgi:hypothetical protein
MGLEIDDNRSKLAPTPEGEVINANLRDMPNSPDGVKLTKRYDVPYNCWRLD